MLGRGVKIAFTLGVVVYWHFVRCNLIRLNLVIDQRLSAVSLITRPHGTFTLRQPLGPFNSDISEPTGSFKYDQPEEGRPNGEEMAEESGGASDEMGFGSCHKKLTQKGHFVVYAIDGRRFVVPLAYLNSAVFKELFRVSESEFGMPKNGPITLPCNGVFLEYVMSVIGRQKASQYLEKALLLSISAGRCKADLFHEQVQNARFFKNN
ncbi:hypothetical protein H6P81_017896 [Aristolochia fimbriata]|uniref:Small auxin up regulated protein n=1 Tax=Aristolochia fimbriata TaxID=158543 RepID=A0AAV7DZW8_ARIFI|nr:hypothetical protein H6P81_017896 [Aristolochia fimbriata]